MNIIFPDGRIQHIVMSESISPKNLGKSVFYCTEYWCLSDVWKCHYDKEYILSEMTEDTIWLEEK